VKWGCANTVHHPLEAMSGRGRNEVIASPIVGMSQISAITSSAM
jgi:hypothetical protein